MGRIAWLLRQPKAFCIYFQTLPKDRHLCDLKLPSHYLLLRSKITEFPSSKHLFWGWKSTINFTHVEWLAWLKQPGKLEQITMTICHPILVTKNHKFYFAVQLTENWQQSCSGPWKPSADTLGPTAMDMANREGCRSHNEELFWKFQVTANMGAPGTLTSWPKL